MFINTAGGMKTDGMIRERYVHVCGGRGRGRGAG